MRHRLACGRPHRPEESRRQHRPGQSGHAGEARLHEDRHHALGGRIRGATSVGRQLRIAPDEHRQPVRARPRRGGCICARRISSRLGVGRQARRSRGPAWPRPGTRLGRGRLPAIRRFARGVGRIRSRNSRGDCARRIRRADHDGGQ